MLSKLKLFFTILCCKTVRVLGMPFGRGDVFAGHLAKKLCPELLSKLFFSQETILIIGSCGKSTTAGMLSTVFSGSAKTFLRNREDETSPERMTAFLLAHCTLTGKLRHELLLLEADEEAAVQLFKAFSPFCCIVTNLIRDRLSENGHPEWFFESLDTVLPEDTLLILNADDPLVSKFGAKHEKTVYYGLDPLPFSEERNLSICNDGVYCPVCKAPMQYEYYQYNHFGKYYCPYCGFTRPQPQHVITEASLDSGFAIINHESKIYVPNFGIYQLYNMLASYTAAAVCGIREGNIVSFLNNYSVKSERIVSFTLGNKRGTLLTSLYENYISYDQSIRLALRDTGDITVLLLLGRTKFLDSSWLWDIDFELLSSPKVKRIVLSGFHANDLAVRLSYCNTDDRVCVLPDPEEAVGFLKDNAEGRIYVLTCDADRQEFLDLTEVTPA